MKSSIKLRDKIIFVLIIIVILANFIFSKPVHASIVGDVAGTLMEEICKFVVFLRGHSVKHLTNNVLC